MFSSKTDKGEIRESRERMRMPELEGRHAAGPDKLNLEKQLNRR